MKEGDIPTTFDEWFHCITVKCKISLTPEFARKRIAALEDPKSAEAAGFAKIYGEAHRERVVEWYRRVAS